MSKLIKSEKRRRFYPDVRPRGGGATVEDVFDFYIYPVANFEALTTAEQLIFRHAKQVIVIAECTNPGMSITNGMECCIKSLQESGDMSPIWSNYIVVEHYPEESFHRFEFEGKHDESFDLVLNYDHDLHWASFSRDRLEQLIGEVFNG